jgi:hypothetical protein
LLDDIAVALAAEELVRNELSQRVANEADDLYGGRPISAQRAVNEAH